MRLELSDDNTIVESDISGIDGSAKDGKPKTDHLNMKSQIREQNEKLSEMTLKGKLTYIWDYYKWWFVGALAVIIISVLTIREIKDNMRPVYIYALLLNSYYAVDESNTLKADYINQFGVNTDEYKLYIDDGISLTEQGFDTTMLANQQKIVSMYSAAELDVVIGPVNVLEGPANCDAYADLTEMLPKDLIDELVDRDYEFYYFDPHADEIEDSPDDDRKPYFAGVYLDNCSYLNNNGEYGAYPVAEDEKDRPVFTIPANTQRPERAVEFLRFLIENR